MVAGELIVGCPEKRSGQQVSHQIVSTALRQMIWVFFRAEVRIKSMTIDSFSQNFSQNIDSTSIATGFDVTLSANG